MRFIYFILSAAITTALCYILDTKSVLKAPLGKLLSPQEGIWQNAEPIDKDFAADFHFGNMEGKVDVFLDDRLVPHIFAEKNNDAYFVQGFLHAKFRLWQMELETLAAAGRASELVGEVAFNSDREFRRLGMVYAAENSLQEMEKDSTTKKVCDAYTAGVNAYISTLTNSSLPIEYKLLDCKPEKWSNLKSALFLKYMAYDLSSYGSDFEMTNAKGYFSKSDFDKLFPLIQDSLSPIIPGGTIFAEPKVKPVVPAFADSIYFDFLKERATAEKYNNPDRTNGSNNWAVASSKTKNGYPILCNDPHLGLMLPSIWYEMQISTPDYNTYGASFPGAPGIMIGFNDNCAFGFTNAGRDVLDYYDIKFKDDSKREYWFDSSWKKTTQRIEQIKILGKPDFFDTVAYTIFGPVMYDASFGGKIKNNKKNYAVRWKAHDNSNELKFFILLNKAKNYDDYLEAVKYLQTPGQNVGFACKNGDIAIRTEGKYPAKWNGQGDFVMPGFDSSYMWQGMIPEDETPFQYNPERGFVSSANQRPVDSTYPYYLGREYPLSRGFYLNRKLASMQNITVQDMMALQTSNYNVFAEMAMPILLKNIQQDKLNQQEIKYYQNLSEWNFENNVKSTAATIFELTWKKFTDTVFYDEYFNAPENTAHPFESTLLEAVLKDSAYKFIDNIATIQVETLNDIVTAAFKSSALTLKQLEIDDRLEWGKYKDTHIDYLLKFPSFSSLHIPIGGTTHSLNAAIGNHGPSWKMVVSLTPKTEAYGIYPGGQSGNPGSRFYDDAVGNWAAGYYYELWLMKKEEQNDKRIRWKMNFGR